jgi:hypothetical protein
MEKFRVCLFILLVLFAQSIIITTAVLAEQDDTVYIQHTLVIPIIDGKGNDNCWELARWQTIDQPWKPWGEKVHPDDFQGAYRVLWSSETNLLYFLIRTTDDIRVDNYIPGVTSEIYNFDIIELFIDEDQSRGRHAFDVFSTGENAENAFGYHMHVRYPENGNFTDSMRVQDLSGSGWDDNKDPVYNSHFGDFIVRRIDNVVFWEFSLKVYGDTYYEAEKEKSRVTLIENKIMGLSIAYCDNDDPLEIPKVRDNFIGSVWVPEEAYDDHWQDAEYFGIVRLVGSKEK